MCRYWVAFFLFFGWQFSGIATGADYPPDWQQIRQRLEKEDFTV
jgi:hypothetical protein